MKFFSFVDRGVWLSVAIAIFLALVSLVFAETKTSHKKKMIKFFIAIMIILLGISTAGTIFSGSAGLAPVPLDTDVSQSASQSTNPEKEIVNSSQVLIIPSVNYSELSNADKKIYAQNYIYAENYIEAANIYMMEELKNDPIALHNLAYMRSQGLFFEQDIDLAIELYSQSLANCTDSALLSLILQHKMAALIGRNSRGDKTVGDITDEDFYLTLQQLDKIENDVAWRYIASINSELFSYEELSKGELTFENKMKLVENCKVSYWVEGSIWDTEQHGGSFPGSDGPFSFYAMIHSDWVIGPETSHAASVWQEYTLESIDLFETDFIFQ